MARPYAETIGSGLAEARRARGWSQRRLATDSGVPQTVISAIERAALRHPPLETVGVLCAALDAELLVEIRAAHVVGRTDQRDPAHAACVGTVIRILERAAWVVASEVEIVTGRSHGFIDLLAYDAARRRILVIEIKTEVRDVGGLDRQVGWYLREARGAAARLGWRPRSVAAVVIVLATAAADAAIVANRRVLDQAFPRRGRAVREALLHGGELTHRGLLMVDPQRRGAAALLGTVADGRRTPAPYRDYGGFMAARRAGRNGGPRV
jgi:transcriptional regulator with XRE-family HTH domain